jgi:HSP20 family molecular chaperone IbpA
MSFVLPLTIVARKRDQLDQLQGEIQELIDELWQVPRFSGLRRGFRPQVDVVRTEDPPEFRVVVELAGIDPESLRIFADDRTLVVAGVRSRPSSGRYFNMEIEDGPFQRRVQFTEAIDAAGATAEYRRGLLTVTLPVAERKPVGAKISIKIGPAAP